MRRQEPETNPNASDEFVASKPQLKAQELKQQNLDEYSDDRGTSEGQLV